MIDFLAPFKLGSYDHTVKVWDMRSGSSILSMDHGSPVECVQLFPSGGICVSAGDRKYAMECSYKTASNV